MRRALSTSALDELVTLPHQRPNRRRRGVEQIHRVLVAYLPEAAEVRIVRHPLEHHRRRPVRQRRVHHVRMPGHPPDVRRAPEDIPLVVVEDVLERERRIQQVPRLTVLHPLRLAGRARGVEDEQRVLGVERLGRTLRRGIRHRLVVPHVATLAPRHLVAGAPHHDAGVGIRARLQRPVRIRLQRHVAPAPRPFVRRHHHPALGVEDAVA